MTCGDVVRAVVAQLGPEERAATRRILLRVKPTADAEDLDRGIRPEQRAYFYGVSRQLGRQGDRELPDPRPAEGEIVLLLDRLAPLTALRVRTAFAHELGHALGWEEAELVSMGLVFSDEGGEKCCG